MFHTKVAQKIKTHFMFNNFPQKSCRLKNYVKKYGTAGGATDYNIIRRMRIECWITKATNTDQGAHTHTHTHSEYAMLIAFPWQQWLRERASMLRLYVHCLSCNNQYNASLRCSTD